MVGVMGGHGVERGSAGYADAVRLGPAARRRATPSRPAAGPARWRRPTSVPGWRPATGDEVEAALAAVARGARLPRPDRGVGGRRRSTPSRASPGTADTLGIPTWHYGHEPPNVFASAIAKYVRNAVREAVLLEVCDAGIVFLPGAGGHGAGGLPGRLRELLRRPGLGRPDGAGRAPHWTEDAAGVAAAAPARGRAARWPATSTSSTPSRRRPRSSADRVPQDSVAASWPQAPSISRPRVSRTVVGMPFASSRRTNSRSSAGSDAVHFEPGRRVERDQVDVDPAPVAVREQHVGEQVGPPGLVVDAAHHGVLDGDPALGGRGRSPRPPRRSRRRRSGC